MSPVKTFGHSQKQLQKNRRAVQIGGKLEFTPEKNEIMTNVKKKKTGHKIYKCIITALIESDSEETSSPLLSEEENRCITEDEELQRSLYLATSKKMNSSWPDCVHKKVYDINRTNE